jgi:aspartokinase-like uncharacterized kinase
VVRATKVADCILHLRNEEQLIRVISARDMHRKERVIYQETPRRLIRVTFPTCDLLAGDFPHPQTTGSFRLPTGADRPRGGPRSCETCTNN